MRTIFYSEKHDYTCEIDIEVSALLQDSNYRQAKLILLRRVLCENISCDCKLFTKEKLHSPEPKREKL
jgi:hypothetical protein